jgi:hypothetical protein
MNGPINVKSPNNISKLHMGFNSAFKGLMFDSPFSENVSSTAVFCIVKAYITPSPLISADGISLYLHISSCLAIARFPI